MEEEQSSPNPSTLLRDISNFKTPKHAGRIPFPQSPFPHFFTAPKQSPSSSSSAYRRRTSIAPSSRSKAARKLKAFEVEQSQSSRKAQIRKEKSLKCLAKSLTAWLNFLFENPKACGCELSNGADRLENAKTVLANGKRDSWPGVEVGVDGAWRIPKRQKDNSWQTPSLGDAEPPLSLSAFSSLEVSLREVCSLEDLTQRMRAYLSFGGCKEVLSLMSQITKNIDEGRLKMKAHCPMVTDVGLKKKATKILMAYSPIWLRIGLYIIFGGDSLLPTVGVYSDQEVMFLKMVVEKQFFSHVGLAKAYAYNKLVEGLYRPGYFEALGNVLLKRFLLLVLILDRAKSQSSLPINYGIDGTDGGSPLLFDSQSNIKSSQQVVHDFLSSEVMHGEGNIVAHLVILGYKVQYQQHPILEYDFTIKDLFEDLQDGIRLCRAIQLLQRDASILLKMAVPSDTRKKNVANCGLAVQYLKQAAVPLYDEDKVMIVAEDIANGDKELTLSMLWNIFIHLQLPLLINKTLLLEEICKVKGTDVDSSTCKTPNLMEMLLEWIQGICQSYDVKVSSFESLVDGKAIWCLIDHYFRKELSQSCCHKGIQNVNYEDSILSSTDKTDAMHSFILSQKLTSVLGNFPEVLQTSDILENNGPCSERSVMVLLVFLSSQLIDRKNMDMLNIHKFLGCNCQSTHKKRLNLEKCCFNSEKLAKENESDEYRDAVRNFRAIQTWWEDMANRNNGCVIKPAASSVRCHMYDVANGQCSKIQIDRAAKIIQSWFRGLIERHKFLKRKSAASLLQTCVRAWLVAKHTGIFKKTNSSIIEQQPSGWQEHSHTFQRYYKFLVDRYSFIRYRKSTLLIQQAVRVWIKRSHQHMTMGKLIGGKSVEDVQVNAEGGIQVFRKELAVHTSISNQFIAATKIQKKWRGSVTRKNFLCQRRAALEIQSMIRSLNCQMVFQQCKLSISSAIIIQSYIRGWSARREANKLRHQIVLIQSHCRGWSVRKYFLNQKNAVIKIQNDLRCFRCWKTFQTHRKAAIEIQRFVRGQVDRRRLLGASCHHLIMLHNCPEEISRDTILCPELKVLLYSVQKLQRWWKRVLLTKSKSRAAILIQSHARRWLAKRLARREQCRIVVIQSYWKGYLARKESKEQLQDLRIRVQNSAANVDDSMRLINRLIAAVSELLNMRSVSSILHTCATLDVATKHSQKCCEKLVSAGAIGTLFKMIGSVSRSIPDQEVSKYALSTLRNLAHYPQLVEVLIDTHGSVETLFCVMLRNKEDGYFIASELLKKLCSTQKGLDAVHRFPALLKRLYNLVEDLKRKANNEKRTDRPPAVRENTERRLREAEQLFKLIVIG